MPFPWETKREGTILSGRRSKEEGMPTFTECLHSISFNPHRIQQGKYHDIQFRNKETDSESKSGLPKITQQPNSRAFIPTHTETGCCKPRTLGYNQYKANI